MKKLALIIQCFSFFVLAGETLDVCEGEASETKNAYLMITSSAKWEAAIKGSIEKRSQNYTIKGVGVAVDPENSDRVERRYKLIVSMLGINPLSRKAQLYIDDKAQGEGLVLEPAITVRPSPPPKNYVRLLRCGTLEIDN